MKTKFIILVKSNEKENTVDFIYSKKDLEQPKDMNEKAFLIYVEQMLRAMLDNGFTVNVAPKEDKDGEKIS